MTVVHQLMLKSVCINKCLYKLYFQLKYESSIHKQWTGVMLWIIVMFVSAVWTLILMAPRGSTGEQVKKNPLNFSANFIKVTLFLKAWGWVNDDYILISGWTVPLTAAYLMCKLWVHAWMLFFLYHPKLTELCLLYLCKANQGCNDSDERKCVQYLFKYCFFLSDHMFVYCIISVSGAL